MGFFVGSDGRQAYQSDTIPLSPFATLLNKELTLVTQAVVESHTVYLRRTVDGDVYRWLMGWQPVPSRLANANPLAQYEAAHTWLDPKGYTLSDRIWRVGGRTRDQLDNLLVDGIRRGRAARDIAREAEQFLRPDRAPFRTQRPYGTDASFDAMRLARTEISRAHAQAASLTASLNPYVTGIDYCLSASHPKFDICDGLASIGMGGDRLKEPYPIEGYYPMPVVSSHPQCLCRLQSVVTATPAQVTATLRSQMLAGQAPPPTPANPSGLLLLMLGVFLYSQLEAA
jgi:hypothetical protein